MHLLAGEEVFQRRLEQVEKPILAQGHGAWDILVFSRPEP
jgi:hypothetical protein